jgi:hypothetical protein
MNRSHIYFKLDQEPSVEQLVQLFEVLDSLKQESG